MIILSIVGGVMIATVAASGIYYSYRSKKDREKEKAAAKVSAPSRRSARAENESFVVYQDESLVDFDSIPVQPETRRPIRYYMLLVVPNPLSSRRLSRVFAEARKARARKTSGTQGNK